VNVREQSVHGQQVRERHSGEMTLLSVLSICTAGDIVCRPSR